MTTIDTERHPTSTIRAANVWALLDECFPREVAEAWADGWKAGLFVNPTEVIAYDDHGIPLDQALTWHQHGFDAAEATCFYDRHYTPEQALKVTLLTNGDEDIEWLATGLPADRVIAYLHAGVTLAEYDDFENNDDPTDEALTMLAGFLQPS